MSRRTSVRREFYPKFVAFLGMFRAREPMGRLLWWLCLQLVVVSRGRCASQPKRIDVHTHFVPPFYRQVLFERNLTSGGSVIPQWNATYHLENMARYNVQTSIVSISPPSVVFFHPDEVAARRSLARRLNEYGRNLSVEYPGKFQFFATLTLPDVDGAVAEAVYALDSLHAAGVLLLGNSNGLYLGNPQLDPLMEVLNLRKAVVLVHPNALPGEPDDTGIPPYALDFLLDTSRAATNLMVRNVTRRYPNITFILSHSGGFIPYAAGRLSLVYSELLPHTSRDHIIELLQAFYVDTGYTGYSTLPSNLYFVPHDQVLFGSDWPSEIEGLEYVTSILDTDLRSDGKLQYEINFGNAAKLLNLSIS